MRLEADEVFSVAFFPGVNGELKGARLSHMVNILYFKVHP